MDSDGGAAWVRRISADATTANVIDGIRCFITDGIKVNVIFCIVCGILYFFANIISGEGGMQINLDV